MKRGYLCGIALAASLGLGFLTGCQNPTYSKNNSIRIHDPTESAFKEANFTLNDQGMKISNYTNYQRK